MRNYVVAAFAMLVMAAPAMAQDKPVDVNVGGGMTFPVGDIASSFDMGWNFGAGVTFNFTPTMGFQTEYMYHRMGGPEKQVLLSNLPAGPTTSTGLIESNHQMHVVDFNLVYKVPTSSDSMVGGYVLAGPGYYHRIVQLTTPSVGYTTVCDPYWYVCYPALVSVDQIIGDRARDDFGINFGGGITFGREAKFYVEARYHYVFGGDVSVPAGVTVSKTSTAASYFPITFGFRF